jgi:hypothetical protein
LDFLLLMQRVEIDRPLKSLNHLRFLSLMILVVMQTLKTGT